MCFGVFASAFVDICESVSDKDKVYVEYNEWKFEEFCSGEKSTGRRSVVCKTIRNPRTRA